MTIPPYHEFPTLEGTDPSEIYSNINDMYNQISVGINGTIFSSSQPRPLNYIPTLQGTTPGVFTYSTQEAYVLRVGIMVDLWFDIAWTASGTAAGDLYLTLPYLTRAFPSGVFSGPCFEGTINIAPQVGIYIRPEGNSFDGQFWTYSNTAADRAKLGVSATGKIQGYIRYAGKLDGDN